MTTSSATKIFFDSDAVIAGSASDQGASFILLQLAELGLIQGFISQQVVEECRKNIQIKLPDALSVFERIISTALSIVENPPKEQIAKYTEMAHSKDVPILASATNINAHFLVTFNTKDFYPGPEVELIVIEPGEFLKNIRFHLSQITEK